MVIIRTRSKLADYVWVQESSEQRLPDIGERKGEKGVIKETQGWF